MKHTKLLIVLALVLVVLGVPVLVFFARSPVLIVTDASFSALYGLKRSKRQLLFNSLSLFRRVKPVMIADGASPDIIVIAIKEAARQPFCVVFPRHFASAAVRFHEELRETPAVLLGGLASVSGLPSPDEYLHVYLTDIETDMYRAGLMSGILGGKKQKTEVQTGNEGENEPAQRTIVLWPDRYIQAREREFFSRGVTEIDLESSVFYINSASELPEARKVSCTVLTSAGSEYMDKNYRVPLILFTWLDPALVSWDAAVLFDDSPMALAVPAVRMAALKQIEGTIPSKLLIFSRRIADNGIFRILKKSAKKVP